MGGLDCEVDVVEFVPVIPARCLATVWAPGTGPLLAKNCSGRGRPPKLMRRDGKHRPLSVKELALRLPKRAWQSYMPINLHRVAVLSGP